MATKIFQDLITEVHEKGICQECGGCVSFCSSAEYHIIGFPKPNAPPAYINKDQCLECGICYCVCPQTHYFRASLDEKFKIKKEKTMLIGYYDKIYSCQAKDNALLEHGTDGGVVNALINYLLNKNIIDGAIVAKIETPISRNATIAYNKEDLLKSSGATLEMASHLEEVQKFTTYTSSISELNHYKFKKLAIVGTPCQMYTIRAMQELGVTPSENIEICLGLFCYENFIFDQQKIERFEKDFKIYFKDVIKINIKEDLILKLKDVGSGIRTVHVPFNHLVDYMRPACNACSDFTNMYADISFGGLGSQEKYTTVIPRTDKGKEIFRKALAAGIFKCQELDQDKAKKREDLLIHYAKSKMDRYLKFIKNIN